MYGCTYTAYTDVCAGMYICIFYIYILHILYILDPTRKRTYTDAHTQTRYICMDVHTLHTLMHMQVCIYTTYSIYNTYSIYTRHHAQTHRGQSPEKMRARLMTLHTLMHT